MSAVKKPTVIYEHSTDEEISGVIVDGMEELLGDDVTSSDYDATVEPWPGVPDIPLPDAYIHKDHLKLAKQRPRSINIFLLDGTSDGIRMAQIPLSTIKAIAFRRNKLKEVTNTFPELGGAGVYMLFGYDESISDKQIAYIGESEMVANRLYRHTSNDKGKESKAFWVDTVALVCNDENLTKSHARYVEAKLIAAAAENKSRWELANGNKTNQEGKLPLPDQVSMDEFIDQAKTLIGALGIDLFKPLSGALLSNVEADESVTSATDAVTFSYEGEGFSGSLVVDPRGELVVPKGAKVRLKTNNSIPKGIALLREELEAEGTLVRQESCLLLTKDQIFKSPSSAAGVLAGASINGRVVWRLSDGRTYAEWEEGRLGGVA